MTIQIKGTVWFGGNTSKKIEEYYDNMQDANAAWERLYSKYEFAKCKTDIYAIKSDQDNVRPDNRYGADPYIKGQQLGHMIVGKYA